MTVSDLERPVTIGFVIAISICTLYNLIWNGSRRLGAIHIDSGQFTAIYSGSYIMYILGLLDIF